MRVLHIITGLNDGGAEAVLYRLSTFDTNVQHNVVSLMNEGKYGPLLKQSDINLHCLNMPQGRVSFSGIWKLYKLIRRYKPDVVQTWMYHADLIGGLVARLAGIKNVIWGVHHTTLVKGGSKKSTILIAKLNAFLSYFVPKKIIYCAEKARVVQESIGYKSSKGVVVSNGYDIEKFIVDSNKEKSFRIEQSIKSSIFLIGHVGRYSPYKDYPSFLKALSIVYNRSQNAKCILVGSELYSDNKDLQGVIKQYNLEDNVILLGRRDDIPSVMNGIDLFVLSSVTEAFPNVLNEAMACGTPCVTTDVGDAALIVAETGWVVPPKDPEALADSIMQAMAEKQADEQAWLNRKQACRERIVNNFSIEKMVAAYHKVWFTR